MSDKVKAETRKSPRFSVLICSLDDIFNFSQKQTHTISIIFLTESAHNDKMVSRRNKFLFFGQKLKRFKNLEALFI